MAQVHLCVDEDFLALSAARRAVELAPREAAFLQTRARAHHNFGELTAALRDMTRACLFMPWHLERRQELLDMLVTSTSPPSGPIALTAKVVLDRSKLML